MIETENEDDFFQRLSLQIDPKQEAVRIDKYLSDRLGKISRNRIQQAIKAESVLVNDLPVKSNYKIRPGNLISAVFKCTQCAKVTVLFNKPRLAKRAIGRMP